MLIDTHAHVNFETYKERLDEVFENAKNNDVRLMILPGVEVAKWNEIIEFAEKYENVYGAIGVHPSEIKDFDENAKKRMAELLKHPKIKAVGEVGLDYYWDKEEEVRESQKAVFTEQIKLANDSGKPLIIHEREAHKDAFDILNEYASKDIDIVMHCFSGSPEFMKECVNKGYYIALGGIVTFKNAQKPKEVAKEVPIERLMLETDCPFLTPHPHRGEENEPAYVKYVAQQIAEIKGISYDTVCEITTKNALKVFNIEV
ncbi:TatD family hydrolase [bacterium]|nr:TatD family hydrolase [bacterium]